MSAREETVALLAAPAPPTIRRKSLVVSLLVGLNTLNYFDRYIIAGGWVGRAEANH
jgi:hypothetical protein